MAFILVVVVVYLSIGKRKPCASHNARQCSSRLVGISSSCSSSLFLFPSGGSNLITPKLASFNTRDGHAKGERFHLTLISAEWMGGILSRLCSESSFTSPLLLINALDRVQYSVLFGPSVHWCTSQYRLLVPPLPYRGSARIFSGHELVLVLIHEQLLTCRHNELVA